MKTRMTALILSAALLAALGANAATAEQDAAAEPEAVVAASEPEAVVAAAEPESEQEPSAAETPTAAPTDAAPTDAAGTLSFENLRTRMMASYYPLLTLSENIQTLEEWDYQRTEQDLRNKLNQIADQQWNTISVPSFDPSAMIGLTPEQIAGAAGASAAGAAVSPILQSQLQMQYNAYDEAFDNVRKGKLQADNEGVKRQLRNVQDQTVIMAESLYITCKGLEAQDAALTRTVAALERKERELTLRSELGQVSALTVQQVSAGLAQARSGQKTLRMNLANLTLQLKAMCGVSLDAPLSLGALPQTAADVVSSMDLERDLAKAQAVSYELYAAQKELDDAKEAYDDARKEYGVNSPKNEWMQAQHSWQAAQYTFENAKLSYELKFRTLYAQVVDAAQVADAKRAAVTAQEKSYAADSLKYKQGSLSANALADARDQLSEAKDAAATAERDLFAQYRSYQNAVTYGILNN